MLSGITGFRGGPLTGIIGHTGYAGEELRKCMLRHSSASPVLLDLPPRKTKSAVGTVSSGALAAARRALSRPDIASAGLARQSAEDALAGGKLQAVFLSTPPEVSAEWTPRFLSSGIRVIDLSGAFRLPDAAEFEFWYGAPHPQPQLLNGAVYGLTEINRDKIRTADLVANPGCYATAANLALHPVVSADLIDPDQLIVCDCKSGVSGAGKGDRDATHFCAISENFSVYSALTHRHAGEVIALTGIRRENLAFTAQLLPVSRGLLVTIHFRVRQGVDEESIASAYHEAYGGEGFVHIYEPGSFPDFRSVIRTNRCHVGFTVNPAGRRALIVVALDNLLKGASGQAVQNLNVMFGLNETEGLHPEL